ncbi:dephospho-CoA kinase [Asanoa ishikariensis]|uniref:Dephospho-CoA kinase n=1 Tax=Asanoa ishikariensis TaxID=137265 RepID=A0A1H3PAU0_9ACTN|nr:dephospho-CoA kinase [Asanoa ishikariensis]GIF67961.1 dephospho-CoA kinase [Asanoa ishikariensis]SDY98254.1 dephospho-CoA kinase [Asanoa ishikariensis]
MLQVGLTGGIGAGKSAAASRFAAAGALVIDSDRLAREVVEPGTAGLAEVVAAFGPDVLSADGALDRAALGRVVFGDPTARKRLEGILHPLIRARSAELAAAAPPDTIIVNDVPLLVEGGLGASYHLVVVVDATPEVRIERLVRDRGMTAADAAARIAAQIDDTARRAAADVVLDNSGAPEALAAAVDALWTDRLVDFEANVRAGRWADKDPLATLVDYDPTWPQQYERLAARILRRVGGAHRIDHIGSTAVPGLPAKDVVDIMLTVDSLAEADALAEPLTRAGFPRKPGVYQDRPKPPDAGPWEKRMHANADPGRRVNLHVRVAGSPGWRTALLLRDHLRADSADRDAYAAVKRANAGRPIDDYLDAKEPFFDELYVRADAWAARTHWRP